MPRGRLSFEPMFAPPYVLPLLILNCEGSIRAATNGTFEVSVAFGSLVLPAGGLSVGGVPCPRAVQLSAGESLAWQKEGLKA